MKSLKGEERPRSLRALPASLGLAIFFVWVPVAAAPQGSAAAGATASSAAADSKALASAKSALAPFLKAKDFESRLARAGAELVPADAAELAEYFAPRVADPALKGRMLSGAASLRLLLGDFARAAADIEEGSPASDYVGRLAAARLWLASGESDRASRLAASVINASRDPVVVDAARLVSAWASLLSGAKPAAVALAGGILDSSSEDPSRDSLRREASFLLWAAGDGASRDAEAKRLVASWPDSPEALIVTDSPNVSLMALPHWYLGGALSLLSEGGASSSVAASGGGASPPAGSTVQTSSSPATLPAAASSGASAGTTAVGGGGGTSGQASLPSVPASAAPAAPKQPLRYQAGVFADKVNAQALVDELGKKGFVARIEERSVDGRMLYSVVLWPSDNKDGLPDRLRDSGYEIWLLGD